MKKTYFLAALFGFAAMANAQTLAPASAPKLGKQIQVNKPYQATSKSADRNTGTTRWYSYAETMDAYHVANTGTGSVVNGNYVFPDTTILVDYGPSGYSGPWIHNLADILDVKSEFFNDPSLHPGELYLNGTTPFRVDSVGVYFTYERNYVQNPSVVDTLIFEIGVNWNIPTSGFGPSTLTTNLGTDTVWFKDIPYSYTTNSMNFAQKKVYKFPLDEAFYLTADPATEFHYAQIATPTLPNQNNGGLVAMSVKFKPGYTWVANYDTIANRNGVIFASLEEQENGFPLYTKRDWNSSYIIPQDIRYNLDPNWNGSFIPSFAYMGSTPSYAYEHHWFRYLVSTTLTGVEKSAENGTALLQNEPNPFSKTTTIRYSLDKADNVSLSIIDVTGRVVKTITESNVGAGNHAVTIDASEFNKGVYFYTLKTGGKSFTKRMVIAD